ncbi:MULTISPECIES: HGGxSTG domain-containing protein [unclassified Mesorhizobium]|uniref:HGGxSTG domain-containing protein n=2 Tax=unclassified Mesorhizobium TaxID=325217 RepID=UPI0009FC8741
MQSFQMHSSPRCGARTRSANPCKSPAMPNGRCRLHGGKSPGAPKGNSNAFKHGRYSAEAMAGRRRFRQLLAEINETIEAVE